VSVDEVREAVAARHGLGPDALPFVTGESIEELEASAAKLAGLVGQHRREEEPPAVDPITAALADKDRRRHAVTAMFLGRPSRAQPRDEQGRYARASFDGGARPAVARPPDPIGDHDRAITALASFANSFRGVGF
jgi:hypothetical protein